MGSAIYASLCLEADQGGYDSYEDAVTHMVPDEGTCYLPNAEYMEIYDRMYERYKKFAELVHRTAWEPYTWYVRRYLQIKSNEFPLMKHLKRAIL